LKKGLSNKLILNKSKKTNIMTTLVRTFSPSFPAFANHFMNEFEHKAKANLFTLPSVNVIENETNFEVKLAAPGLKKEDFEIKIHEQTLTISATKKEVGGEVSPNFSKKEFDFSTFKRAFTLPKNINSENVEAVYEAGILSIVLPKLEKVAPKEISVG
jgi:HSP20 family protein